MTKSELEKEYKIILEGYKASLRTAEKLGGGANSCGGPLGFLAEIRAVIDFGGFLEPACNVGWDFCDGEENKVSVKSTHIYENTRVIYIKDKSVDTYEDLCVYFWNDGKGVLELLYKGSIKEAIKGLNLTKKNEYNLTMIHLKELQDAGRDS